MTRSKATRASQPPFSRLLFLGTPSPPTRTPPRTSFIWTKHSTEVRTSYKALEKAAKKGTGSSQVAQGLQSHMDCGYSAGQRRRNALRRRFGHRAGQGSNRYSRPVSVLKSPVLSVTKTGGLTGFEMLQSARALGEVNAVPAKDIPAALAQNQRPVVVRISNQAVEVTTPGPTGSRSRGCSRGEGWHRVLPGHGLEAKKTQGFPTEKIRPREPYGLQRPAALPPKGTVPKLLR